MTVKRTNKADLEERIKVLEEKLEFITTNFNLTPVIKSDNSLHCGEPFILPNQSSASINLNTATMRKPVMYFYNNTGDNLQVAVDFQFEGLHDTIPKVRDDNKIIFTLDNEGFINNKYKYLYYEINFTKELPKAEYVYYLDNNKYLDDQLRKLCMYFKFWNNEIDDFVAYWELELKRIEDKYIRCDIYTEVVLDELFPIDIVPKPGWMIRRYIRFVPVDKKGREKIDIPFKQRAHEFKVCEWGGLVSDSKNIK